MSSAGATAGASAVGKTARVSSASLSRRGTNRRRQPSRGARGCLQLEEMSDLILASQMVPSGRIETTHCGDKVYLQSDAASTAVPSSAEQTPEMNILPSFFPSLAKTSAQDAGWELCSEASDIDALPDPAIDIEDTTFDVGLPMEKAASAMKAKASWLLVDDKKSAPKNDQQEQPSPKLTFADVMRNAKDGEFSLSRTSPVRQPRRSQSRQRKAVACNDEDTDDGHEYVDQTRWHGWKAEHKACWNAKQQRKVEASKAKRVEQSCRSRGWIE